MVMALYAIAKLIEARAVDRARNAIKSLIDLTPQDGRGTASRRAMAAHADRCRGGRNHRAPAAWRAHLRNLNKSISAASTGTGKESAISDDFAITNPRSVPPHAFSLRARSRRLIHQFVNDLLASFSRTIGLYRGRITIRIEARKTALLTHGSFSLSTDLSTRLAALEMVGVRGDTCFIVCRMPIATGCGHAGHTQCRCCCCSSNQRRPSETTL